MKPQVPEGHNSYETEYFDQRVGAGKWWTFIRSYPRWWPHKRKYCPQVVYVTAPVSSREVPWVQRLTGPLAFTAFSHWYLGMMTAMTQVLSPWLWNGKPTETAPRNQGRLANLRKRQDFAPCANFVASIMPCRNNSGKISPKFLESGQNRRTFASSIRQNKFWETQTRELIK